MIDVKKMAEKLGLPTCLPEKELFELVDKEMVKRANEDFYKSQIEIEVVRRLQKVTEGQAHLI